jgi:hypothetical protein
MLFIILGLLASISGLGEAQGINVDEHQITVSSAEETEPSLGNDAVSDLVVYTMQVSLGMGKCTKNGNENCTTPMGGTW